MSVHPCCLLCSGGDNTGVAIHTLFNPLRKTPRRTSLGLWHSERFSALRTGHPRRAVNSSNQRTRVPNTFSVLRKKKNSKKNSKKKNSKKKNSKKKNSKKKNSKNSKK